MYLLGRLVATLDFGGSGPGVGSGCVGGLHRRLIIYPESVWRAQVQVGSGCQTGPGPKLNQSVICGGVLYLVPGI